MRLYFFLITILFCGLNGTQAYGQSDQSPSRIMLNPLEEGHTGVSVTWRVPMAVNEGVIQYGPAIPNPVVDLSIFESKEADMRIDTVEYNGVTLITKNFRVKIDGLTPGIKYMYRVGNPEDGWSEWIQFDLAVDHPDSSFTFIYLGDPQNDLHSQWSRVLRQAYATVPHAKFLLYAGDLVNKGYNDVEWGDWYKAGGFIHRTVPSIMTPGNHEYTNVILSPLWRTHFTLPENGPEGEEALYGACYYIDYPSVRVISLDGEQIDEDPELRLAQVEWLEAVLEETKQPWTILTLHYPFYSTKPNRDNPKLRKAFKPILDKYNVDLVLQGHDHGYGRGMLDEKGPGNEGTMYVVSVSGPKMYDVGDLDWMQKGGSNLQLYQVLTTDNDVLQYRSYTADGKLYDAFDLQKSSEGNILIEK
ncbi:purple acid phosphatase family protein [Membranihabitans marinus]|uniref:purple acid phosphatase family protein n=1 Tax=Membranihabitans marinus TaxID=1227546 RepID=UPI001F16A8A3|nr:metallophosphoesterase family protein [Membranihabitans marinus]